MSRTFVHASLIIFSVALAAKAMSVQAKKQCSNAAAMAAIPRAQAPWREPSKAGARRQTSLLMRKPASAGEKTRTS